MKKTGTKTVPAVIAVIAVLLVLLAAFYTRPRTIEQRFPEIDLSRCTRIRGSYSVDGNGGGQTEVAFSPGDAQFDGLVSLFRNAAFRTRAANLFPQPVKMHPQRDGDFQWSVTFVFGDVTIGGAAVSGDLLSVGDFYGDIGLSFDGEETRCSLRGQEQWSESVLAGLTGQTGS